jgi:DNA-binding MarR family transcriptional regulator
MTLTPDHETDTAGLPLDGGLWLSISELAKVKGVTKQTISERVSKLEREELITTRAGKGKSKLINVAEYDRALGETSDLSKQQGARTKEALAGSAGGHNEPRGAASAAFTQQQTLRAGYDAEMKRLDLEERLGNLCDRADVESRTFSIFRRVRDRLLSLPSISAPRLANAVDQRAARAILDEDIRKVLDAMAHDLDNPDVDDMPLEVDDEDRADGLASTVAPVREASAAVAAADALRSDEE